jgi:hypothetical protein
MMTALIILGSIFAYILIGGLVAKASLPALWRRARGHWDGSYFRDENWARGDVVTAAVCRALFWPVMGLYEILARSIDRSNPFEMERRLKQQEARIRELEHELGVGR